MPKKKSKGTKKKKKKSSEKDEETTDLNLEGDGAQLGISKKKKEKKAKLTKEEKAAAKLAKKLDKFIEDERLYNTFLQKIDYWMMTNRTKVEQLFKNFDQEGDGIVPFEIFRSGLRDLNCPITEIELYALVKKLDPEDSGMVEYDGFERGIHHRVVSDEEEEDDRLVPEDYFPGLHETKNKIIRTGLNDPLHQDHPRHVDLHMRLATFDLVKNHPCHFRVTVHAHLHVKVLIELVREIARVSSGDLHIYTEKTCQVEHRLPERNTLEQCGVVGGPLRKPTRSTLYYDYIIEYSDCPLLNCDHYFGIEKTPKNPVLYAFPDYLESTTKKK